MKIFVARLSLIVLSLVLLGACQIVDTNQEVICSPDNSKDCYPKIFVPTTEWQIIREKQDIPAGLHVRLNIETLEKEAKLMDPEDQDISNGVVVAGEEVGDQPVDTQMDLNKEQREEIRQKVAEFKKSNSKPRASVEELNNFQSAVDEVLTYEGDKSRLMIALDTLVELSHDIELGVNLTQDKRIFSSFQELVVRNIGEDVEEIIYRIMGSSLRNNPEAIKNTLEGQSSGFVDKLFDHLSSSTSDIIQKRILGIIQSLNQDRHFRALFFNNSGVIKLVQIYTSLGNHARERLINIFEDIHMVPEVHSNDRRSVQNSVNADWNYSQMLQNILAENRTENKEQLQLFFNKLVEIHQNSKNLEVSSEFLQWLSKEVSTNVNEERDSTPENKKFREEMLHARHVVFGNPHGLRKALADEL